MRSTPTVNIAAPPWTVHVHGVSLGPAMGISATPRGNLSDSQPRVRPTTKQSQEPQAVGDRPGGPKANREAEQSTEENAEHRVSLRANRVAESKEQAANNAEDYEDDKPAYGFKETHESVSTFRRLELVDELWELVHHAVTGDLFNVPGA